FDQIVTDRKSADGGTVRAPPERSESLRHLTEFAPATPDHTVPTTSMNTIVTGLQWGDEGKGKIVDYLTETADVVVRGQGGNNASHTVIARGTKSVLPLLPSGILWDGKINVI